MRFELALRLATEDSHPLVRIDQRKAAGREGGAGHKSRGVFVGVRGRRVVCKPFAHGGREEDYDPSHVQIWKSRSLDGGHLSEKAIKILNEEAQFVIVDTRHLTFFAGGNAERLFSPFFDHAIVYDGGKAQSNANRAKSQISRHHDGKYKGKISSPNNLKAINLHDALELIEEADTEDQKRRILLGQSVTSLNIPPDAKNALKVAGFKNLGELSKKTEDELKAVQNLSFGNVAIIIKELLHRDIPLSGMELAADMLQKQKDEVVADIVATEVPGARPQPVGSFEAGSEEEHQLEEVISGTDVQSAMGVLTQAIANHEVAANMLLETRQSVVDAQKVLSEMIAKSLVGSSKFLHGKKS